MTTLVHTDPSASRHICTPFVSLAVPRWTDRVPPNLSRYVANTTEIFLGLKGDAKVRNSEHRARGTLVVPVLSDEPRMK